MVKPWWAWPGKEPSLVLIAQPFYIYYIEWLWFPAGLFFSMMNIGYIEWLSFTAGLFLSIINIGYIEYG